MDIKLAKHFVNENPCISFIFIGLKSFFLSLFFFSHLIQSGEFTMIMLIHLVFKYM